MGEQKHNKYLTFAKDNTMLIFLILLFTLCLMFVPRFATVGNFKNVLIQIAINALIGTMSRKSTN